jgi:hypothetical protein
MAKRSIAAMARAATFFIGFDSALPLPTGLIARFLGPDVKRAGADPIALIWALRHRI